MDSHHDREKPASVRQAPLPKSRINGGAARCPTDDGASRRSPPLPRAPRPTAHPPDIQIGEGNPTILATIALNALRKSTAYRG